MKRVALFIILPFFAASVNAQDPGYKGPAATSVKKFWETAIAITELLDKGTTGSLITSKMTPLERSFNEVKTKDPSYNTSSMEAELKKIKDKIQDIADKKGSSQAPEIEVSEMRTTLNEKKRELFGDEVKFGVMWDGLPTIQGKIDAYKQTASEAIELNDKLKAFPVKNAEVSDYVIDKIEEELEVSDEKCQKLVTRAKEVNDVRGVQCAYYELLQWQAYWYAASKIYPGHTAFLTRYNAVSAIIKEFGTPEQMAAMAQNKKADEIKNRKMPPAVVKDAALEKMFMDAFNKRYKEEFKGSAIKAVILQSDWHTKRNELTGVITGRTREGAIAYKGANGKCYLIKSYFIHEEYIGGVFKNASSIYVVHSGEEMLCENVK